MTSAEAHVPHSAEWLVRIDVDWPPTEPAQRRDELLAAESARVGELIESGTISRLWRIPGRWSSWSIWRAPDAAAVHAAIISLPLWPWMAVEVHPLAAHPLDARPGPEPR